MNSILSIGAAHWQLILATLTLSLVAALWFSKRLRRVIVGSALVLGLILVGAGITIWFVKPAWLATKVTVQVPVEINKQKVNLPFEFWLDPKTGVVQGVGDLSYFRTHFESLMRQSGALPDNGKSTSHDFNQFRIQVRNGAATGSFHDDVTKYAWGDWPWGGGWKTKNGEADVDVHIQVTPIVETAESRVLPSVKVDVSFDADGGNWYSVFADRINIIKVRTEVEKHLKDALGGVAAKTKEANSALKTNEQSLSQTAPIAAWLIEKGLIQLQGASFTDGGGKLKIELKYGMNFKSTSQVLGTIFNF